MMFITTTDNPYDPITDWDYWYDWDVSQGYDTMGLLARFATDNAYNLDNLDELIMRFLACFSDIFPGRYKTIREK